MLKKYTAIFIMSLAWVILFGHSIVPHNHHSGEQIYRHHLSSDHDDNDNRNPLTEAFAHFFHDADGITFIDSKISADHSAKHPLPLLADYCFIHFIEWSEEPPFQYPSFPDPVTQSPGISPSGLRAPPVFIG